MTTLSDVLLRHAAERPEVPWLFYAEGWDWRWLSWGEAARRVAAEAQAFAAHPTDHRVPFPYRPTPASLLTDLAIQRAGLVPVPLAEREAPLPESGGRGVGVMVRAGDGLWEEWSEADLIAAAAAVAREVAPAGPPLGGREILVSCRSLAEPVERAVLAWALLEGAALLLEPDPAAFAATAAWARPTFFHGTAAEIATLRRSAESAPGPLLRRPSGLPFRRLRVILSIKDGGAAPEEEEFWRRRGVRLASLDFLPRRGTNGPGRGI